MTDNENRTNPPVGPHGNDPTAALGVLPEWTVAELQEAEAVVREQWLRDADAAVVTALHGQYGLPRGRTRGYYAARAHLLYALLYPPRYVTGLPPTEQTEQPDWSAVPLIMLPMREDKPTRELPPSPDPRLLRQYRCPHCSCGVKADHRPMSPECVAAKALRHDSITADDD